MKKTIVTRALGLSALALINANTAMALTTMSEDKTFFKSYHYTHSKRKLPPNIQNISAIFPAETIYNPSIHHGLPVGLYVGAQAGYGDPVAPQFTRPGYNPVNNSGIAWRLILGYQLNKKLAIEASYLSLKTTKAIHQYSPVYEQQVNSQNVIDIAGKSSYPLNDKVHFYGKVGIAYITTAYDLNKIDKYTGNTIVTIDDNRIYGVARHKFAPEVSVGIDFNVRPNVVINTSLTHIHPVGSNRPGNINYLAVGVNYLFS